MQAINGLACHERQAPTAVAGAIDPPKSGRYNYEQKFHIWNNSGERKMTGTVEFSGYIDGSFVRGDGAAFAVLNPSDESVVATLNGLSLAQFAAAIAAARRAFDSRCWSALPMSERAAVVRRLGEALARRATELTDLAVAEAGCPRSSSVMMAQVRTPLRQLTEIVDLFLSLPETEENPLPLHERIHPTGQAVQSLRRYTPIGVVAGFAASNVPFYTAMWKVVPALLAGNSVILRPNQLTPLSALLFGEAANEAGLPPGILNVVIEGGLEGGHLLSTDPRVDMIAFTGSSPVGALLMAQAAPTMKRLQLELGGKSAAIYLPDSIDKAVNGAMTVCVAHAGQGCALGTRILVPEESKPKLLAAMAEAVSRIRQGPADDPQMQMGPVVSAAQRARCEHFVAAAVAAGARIVAGGKRPTHLARGFYFEPTILDVPDNGNPAAQEEIFGPVVCVIGYRDLDHAVAMANDSRYGLSAYVYGQDRQAALKVGLNIKSGTVQINAPVASTYASAGGQRMSGVGRERGIEGLRLYQQLGILNLG
jgi:aldehyde dehydrogenase (NAD+)